MLDLTSRQAQAIVPYLEQASYVLVALIGGWLVYRAYKTYRTLAVVKAHHAHDHHHEHSHDPHDHHHAHEDTTVCSSCGHSHAPSPESLSEKANWKEVMGVILSIGLRPCSGSVLVLVFAEVIALRWAGIASVFAISFGTALTVSFLAIFATYFRKAALHFSQSGELKILSYSAVIFTFLGGTLIFALGLSLWLESSLNSHPLF